MNSKSIEYKVRPVTRYIVTRFSSEDFGNGKGAVGSEVKGEFDNGDTAYEVAYALCRDEHQRLGYPLDDDRVCYPLHPGAAPVPPKLQHSSDCAIHNGPAYATGGCDCISGKRLSDA